MADSGTMGRPSPLALREEAAAYCRVSLRTFDRVVAPMLERVRIGTRVLYEWEELDRWLEQQKVGPSELFADRTFSEAWEPAE